MTQKEFITNFLRGLGFTVLDYKRVGGNTTNVTVQTLSPDPDVPDRIRIYVDNTRAAQPRVSLKFKSYVTIDGHPEDFKSIEFVRKANAWLQTRKFTNCVADWAMYRTYRYHPERKGLGYLRIRCTGKCPWKQCRVGLTDSQVLDDAFGEQEYYKETFSVIPKFDW